MTWIIIYKSLDYVFKSFREYGISLNPNKCAFMLFIGMILGFIVSKEGKLLYPKKIQAIINMPPHKNPQHIQVFNGMAQFYKCFSKEFIAIMAPITKLTRKIRTFFWIKECQKAWESIKYKHIKALTLISPN
jgi:hypothetical protein